jgi:alkanesulfonate monooxygenase SsuD/methylene tetrahydromethanopterin reductase-like flavin-dependent oxidoreductase (luciferase family)
MDTGTPASRSRWKNSSSEVSSDRDGRHWPVPTISSMAAFQPTLAPPGRLVRLGVVLDARGLGPRLAEVARMCDRAGIGAIWMDDSAPPGASPPPPSSPPDPLAGLRELAAVVGRAALGAMLDGGRPLPALDGLPAGRLELTFTGQDGRAAVDELLAVLDASGGRTAPPRTPPRPTLAVEAGDPERLDRERLAWLAGVADDVLVVAADVDRAAEQARTLREAFALAGRDPASLGVAVRLPVSIGRTVAEATARWDAEPAFAALGPPDRAGVFGTLEQCHERVIALAHAGVTDLRCVLPNAPDIHDVIAQATAMTVGTVAKLVPGAPRSEPPPPPEGWGGRSRFPRPPR